MLYEQIELDRSTALLDQTPGVVKGDAEEKDMRLGSAIGVFISITRR